MKKFISFKNYEHSYNQHLEKITRLQSLLAIEEQKLLELIQTKKQYHKKPPIAEKISAEIPMNALLSF